MASNPIKDIKAQANDDISTLLKHDFLTCGHSPARVLVLSHDEYYNPCSKDMRNRKRCAVTNL